MIVLSNLKKNKFLLLAVIIAFAINAFGQHKLTVDVKKTVAVVSPQMWGIFFEDINFAADGGLYGELIKNGSFEFPMPLMGWKETKQQQKSNLLIINDTIRNPYNPRY